MAGVDRTKMHNLKVENDVVFEEVLKTIAWETLSQMALRNCSKEVVEETGYIGTFIENKTKKTKCKVKHQKITSNHKKPDTQMNDYSAFLHMGRCKNLGSLKPFLGYAS